ncbi:MAG TPA: AzlD domain-containing protein [Burkholderiaceae bacterium]|nr:AzlD domain-containing protein [Burkholderiaceae bacterium]
MTTTSLWLTLIGLAFVTAITRNFFLVLGDKLRLSPRLSQALRYAPACALAGLIAPEVLLDQGRMMDLPDMLTHPPLWGILAALATMVLTRNMALTLALGMAAFTALRWFA